MDPRATKPFMLQMRGLHRDLGHFTAGLTIIFALSGVAQIFRDTDFLQHDEQIETQLPTGLEASALGPQLRMRDFKVLRTEGEVLYFQGGSYDRGTGHTVRTVKEFDFPLDRFSNLHKSPSKKGVHWFTMIYGTLLLFMAVSSFFMFRFDSSQQKRGMILAALGLVLAIGLVFMS